MGRKVGSWAMGALLAIAAGVGFVLAGAPRTAEEPPVPGPQALAPAPPPDQPLPPAPPQAPPPAPPGLASLPRPPGVGAAEWARLQQELAAQPQELRRLAGYFAFTDALTRYRGDSGTLSAAERQALARRLDDGLDERLRQRELNIGEARLIKQAVLQDLLADDAQRAEAMSRWQAGQLAATPVDTSHRQTERDFLQRQAAVVSAWQARPVAQRDPQALERELDALRRAAWPSPTATQKGSSR